MSTKRWKARAGKYGRMIIEMNERCNGLTNALTEIIKYHDKAAIDCRAIARAALAASKKKRAKRRKRK